MISIDYIVYGGVKGMITLFDKVHIIKLIEDEGLSIRAASRKTGKDRKTITRYYNEYLELKEKLEKTDCEIQARDLQNAIIEKPNYTKRDRVNRKWTKEMDEFMDYHLELENDRNIKFGINHKQRLTNVMMHELMLESGLDIGLTTVRNNMIEKRKKLQEVFIRQTYLPGQRFEFDYGEVQLMINMKKTKLYLAVISSPYSDYRTAYLYTNQNQKTFLDAHNRLFDEIGGIPQEIVYDNMRNVVTKFIGRSEKQLNEKLVQLAFYYGFNINVTNCFSGNEKGHVEGSVKYIRNKVFTTHYEFDSIEAAQDRLQTKLIELNKKSKIEEEKKHLNKMIKPLDLSEVRIQKVNKYSTVRVENDFYSVPETLVGKKVTVKNYMNDLEVFYNHNLVCRHNKKDGELEYVIDITHFLQTFKCKPGALKNSEALLNNPDLKSIFDKYYSTQPKYFIEILAENKNKNSEILNEILLNNHSPSAKSKEIESNIQKAASSQLEQYTKMMLRRMN